MNPSSWFIFARLYDSLLEPMLHRWKQRVSNWIKEHETGLVLDICCGTGKQCRMIAPHTPVVGLDLDLSMLRYAKTVATHIAFVCGDAECLPFKSGVFSATLISLALHDKPPKARTRMLGEAMRISGRNGHHLFIDFERLSSFKAKVGYIFVYGIEFLAGWQHFRNGRQFVKQGGLTQFLHDHRLAIHEKHTSTWGSSSMVLCKPQE